MRHSQLSPMLNGCVSLLLGAILAGVVALHNPRVLAQATNLLKLGTAAAAPVVAGTAVEENAAPEQPAPSGASIGQQLIAKAAQAQQQKAVQQSRPALPFHPGAGISR